MLSTWSGRVATERKTWISCRLMWWRSTGKGAVTCALLWMKSMILRPGCRGQRWERYWCMWGCNPAGGQWDNQDGKASCRKRKGPLCGAGLPSALLWGFLRLLGWQLKGGPGYPAGLCGKRGSGKGTVTCALLWMGSMILRPGCRGQIWGRYWCMWGWS